jgi:hypothetical protein
MLSVQCYPVNHFEVVKPVLDVLGDPLDEVRPWLQLDSIAVGGAFWI